VTVICFANHHQFWESGKSCSVDLLSIRYKERKDPSWAINRASLKWAKESERSKRHCALNRILMLVLFTEIQGLSFIVAPSTVTLYVCWHIPWQLHCLDLWYREHIVCYCLTCQYRNGQLLLLPLKCVEWFVSYFSPFSIKNCVLCFMVNFYPWNCW